MVTALTLVTLPPERPDETPNSSLQEVFREMKALEPESSQPNDRAPYRLTLFANKDMNGFACHLNLTRLNQYYKTPEAAIAAALETHRRNMTPRPAGTSKRRLSNPMRYSLKAAEHAAANRLKK